ncbi:MAG: hypothetical protein AAFX56_12975 [Pseudomonadota bacterium]
MSDELFKTVRLVRRAKVETDERGRSVWSEPVQEAELELVSTQMLQQMLASDDDERRERLEEAASERDGVLARNTTTEQFEVIDDDDLEAALSVAAESTGPGRVADVIYEPVVDDSSDTASTDELSLVSTQMLRQILGTEDDTATAENKQETEKPEGGFDPYNSG